MIIIKFKVRLFPVKKEEECLQIRKGFTAIVSPHLSAKATSTTSNVNNSTLLHTHTHTCTYTHRCRVVQE